MSTTTEYATVRDLPDVVQRALHTAGYGRRDIAVHTVTSVELASPAAGDGYRGFTILVDLATDRFQVMNGSWGGANPFTHSPVDSDHTRYTLPSHGVVIRGQVGGGRPVWAQIYVPAAMRDRMLTAAPSGPELTVRQLAVLHYYRCLISSYRKERLEREGLMGEIDGLVALGMLSRNRAGATQLTTKGKSLAPSQPPRM